MSTKQVTAIFVPVQPSQPAQLVLVRTDDGLASIRALVNGQAERAQYDRDSSIWVDEDGRSKNRAVNTRVTEYIRYESVASQQRGMIPYDLVGDIVIIGETSRERLCDVPQRLIERFEAQALELDNGIQL